MPGMVTKQSKAPLLKNYFQIWKSKIIRLPILRQLLEWAKLYAPPGFSDVPVYYVLLFIYEEAKKDNITMRSNSIAFSLFLAIFPLLIFLFTLLPHIPIIQDYVLIIDRNLKNLLPTNAHDYVIQIINDITSIKRSGLLSLGFILSIFFASNGVITLMKGFDKSYDDVFIPRHWLKKRWIAMGLTFVLSLLFIVVIAMVIVSKSVLDWVTAKYIINDWVLIAFSQFIRIVLGISLIYTCISLIYQYGPSLYRKFPFFNAGAITATILFIFGTWLFSFFINNFGQYNEIYGSIGALIVVMIWFQFNSFILLVGFELNASIVVVKQRMLEDKLNEAL